MADDETITSYICHHCCETSLDTTLGRSVMETSTGMYLDFRLTEGLEVEPKLHKFQFKDLANSAEGFSFSIPPK